MGKFDDLCFRRSELKNIPPPLWVQRGGPPSPNDNDDLAREWRYRKIAQVAKAIGPDIRRMGKSAVKAKLWSLLMATGAFSDGQATWHIDVYL